MKAVEFLNIAKAQYSFSEEEKIIGAMQEYAKYLCGQQRKICSGEIHFSGNDDKHDNQNALNVLNARLPNFE